MIIIVDMFIKLCWKRNTTFTVQGFINVSLEPKTLTNGTLQKLVHNWIRLQIQLLQFGDS